MKMPLVITQLLAVCLLYESLCSLYAQPNVYPSVLPRPVPSSAAERMEESAPAQAAPSDKQQPEPQEPLLPERAAEILDYWFGYLPNPGYIPDNKVSIWIGGVPEMDRQLGNFSQDVLKVRTGEYNSWRETPRGRLALIILLDQLPRHLYRNRPQEFSSDPMARGLTIEGIQKGDDRQLYPIERAFFYLPLKHAEDPAMQRMSVAAYQRLLADAPPEIRPEMQDFLDYAIANQQQIARFGRFPARNAILRRNSTPEEVSFLRRSNQ